MVHSHSARAFERGREALATLTERHPEHALPRAWLAMWHALSVVKGSSANPARDIKQAREQTLRALQAEPGNAMAQAVEGYIQFQLLGNLKLAHGHLTSAVEANPSEPMAWLFKSLFSAMWGSSALAVTEAYVARSLSPVDPLQYFFDMLMGNALLADRQLEHAITCGRKSLKAHKHHVPTLRLLLTAHAELGQIDEGRDVVAQLRAEAPELTVASYLSMGGQESPLRQRMAEAMRQLGLPEA
jgi:adenylate cyclase